MAISTASNRSNGAETFTESTYLYVVKLAWSMANLAQLCTKSRIDARFAKRPGKSEILKLDEPCISNPKSEIADWTVEGSRFNPIFRDFGFEMQDSSNFEMFSPAGDSIHS
jgi:hypothetical protein